MHSQVIDKINFDIGFYLMLMNVFLGIICFLAVLVLSVCVIGNLISSPRYSGPVTDHFNGKYFRNLGGVKVNGFDNVFKLIRTRKPTKWIIPEDIVKEYPILDQCIDNDFRVTYINHATILIQCHGINLITDPVYAKAAGVFGWVGPWRKLQPGISFDNLPKIDFVFISHNHYDHLDIGTIKKVIKKDNPKFITPLGNDLLLSKYGAECVNFDWWEEVQITDEISMVCTPGQHYSSRGLADRNGSLWGGFVLKTPLGSMFWAGDGGYAPFFKEIGERFGPFRFSCIPIGAYKPNWFMKPIHITPTEAVQVHLDVKSQESLAYHWATFNLSDEGWDEPKHDLEKVLKDKNLDQNSFQALVNGGFIEGQW